MYGPNILGFQQSAIAKKFMYAFNPSTREILEGAFHKATPEEIDQAMDLATTAFTTYKKTSGAQRASFLNAIADEILALDDVLVKRAMAESGLPEGRIKGERGRTVNQLRLFAKVAEEGSWVEASIDQAMPDRQPMPKTDIRKVLQPLGPVVVFTASNFPLAFSTAGGDTASALAAGCPVIVKAHEAHLGTNALVSVAIQRAAEKTGMPDGVFSALNGTGPELGQALAKHPQTKAIAFTGSHGAGKALFDAAAQRKNPIPVFAEMGSINPVFVLDNALSKRGEAIAKQYASSVTLGAGQFCTNPGLIIVKNNAHGHTFIETLGQAIQAIAPATMLNENVCKNYHAGRQSILDNPKIQLEASIENVSDGQCTNTVASVMASDFLENPSFQKEIFGPFTLVVKCSTDAQMMSIAERLEGQLTGTIMAEPSEIASQNDLTETLQNKVGRIIFNNVPTGVEVCHSMQHGGPYPATTDGRFTSVGTGAIKRFARPIAFQNWPQDLLPDTLKDGNPTGIWRLMDGVFGKE